MVTRSSKLLRKFMEREEEERELLMQRRRNDSGGSSGGGNSVGSHGVGEGEFGGPLIIEPIPSADLISDSYRPPLTSPGVWRKGHKKDISGSSSTSSRNSSFFDSPTPAATPPPPSPPPSRPYLDSPTGSPTNPRSQRHGSSHIRNSSADENSGNESLLSRSPTIVDSTPEAYRTRDSLRDSISSSTSSAASFHSCNPSSPVLPPPTILPEPVHPLPSWFRLPLTPSHILGTGLRSTVYLSSVFVPPITSSPLDPSSGNNSPSSSSSSSHSPLSSSTLPSRKGKERAGITSPSKWVLTAAKIPLSEDGPEGRAGLRREGMVLRWLGADADENHSDRPINDEGTTTTHATKRFERNQGIVGMFGVVELGGKSTIESSSSSSSSTEPAEDSMGRSNKEKEAVVAGSIVAIRKRRGSSVSSILPSPVTTSTPTTTIKQQQQQQPHYYSTYALDSTDFLDLSPTKKTDKRTSAAARIEMNSSSKRQHQQREDQEEKEQQQQQEIGGIGGEFPALLLEYCPMGTMDSFVKSHPERVDETLWISWVGDLGSAGEWLEERGVVREFPLFFFFSAMLSGGFFHLLLFSVVSSPPSPSGF